MCWGRSGSMSTSLLEKNEKPYRKSAMNEPRKSIPHFANEAEVRAFWESTDSTEYVDWTQARRARVVADLQEYLRRFDAARLPGALEITDADVAQAIAEVRAERAAKAVLAAERSGKDRQKPN